jgi:hypothetical protein
MIFSFCEFFVFIPKADVRSGANGTVHLYERVGTPDHQLVVIKKVPVDTMSTAERTQALRESFLTIYLSNLLRPFLFVGEN